MLEDNQTPESITVPELDLLFGQVIKLLQQGTVICDYTHRALFERLSDERYLHAVNGWLRPLNMVTRKTADGEAFIATWLRTNDPEAVRATQAMFNQAAGLVRHVIGWLAITIEGTPERRPIRAGQIITEAQLLYRMEKTPTLNSRLTELTSHGPWKSTANEVSARLRHLLSKLVADGYLLQLERNGYGEKTTGTEYQATGKWSVFYEMLEFIAAHNDIAVAEPELPPAFQQDLF